METLGQAAAVDMGAKVTYGEFSLAIDDLVLHVDLPFAIGVN